MKKSLINLLFLLLSFIGYTQVCPTPNDSGVFVTLNSTYNLGVIDQGLTNVDLCFFNNTAELATAVQFRVFYDKNAFSSVSEVVSLNTSFPQEIKFLDNNQDGYVTITLTYTGNLSSFNLPNGQQFRLVMTHSDNFPTLSVVGPMTFSGVQTFNNLGTNQPGNDITLTLENFGGVFQPVTFSYGGSFTNINGSGAKNIHIGLERKLKNTSNWEEILTTMTDIDGQFQFSQVAVDTTGYNVRLKVVGDTLSIGNVISVSDAQKINRFVLGIETPVGFDFYTSDVNGNNTITISDAYAVFGKVSGRFTNWPNGVKKVKFFTQSEYNTINGSTSNLTSTIQGVTNFTYNITPNSPESISYYVVVPGDANNTGFQMARMIPLEITNPELERFNIIDVTTHYDNPNLGSIELRYPRQIEVNEQNLVNIPVFLKSNNNSVGSLQFSLKYNSDLLDFKGIVSNSSVSGWLSYLNPNDNEIEWGGYDPTNNTRLLNDNDQVLTLQFISKIIQEEWEESPLYVSKKHGGDNMSYDLKIIPTQGIVSVGRISATPFNFDNNEMIIFPNPTNDLVNIKFSVNKTGNVWLGIFDMGGNKIKTVVSDHMPKGDYQYVTNVGYLPEGVYLITLSKESIRQSKKLIKK